MATPPKRPLTSTASYAPTPSTGDAPSVPAQGGTIPQAGPSPAALASGAAILVPGYEVQAELGRGGMGVVYKARQVGFNRVVALKMLLSGAHAGADERDRFLREAESVARLRHPGIVDVYAFGDLDGCPYFSLEYLELSLIHI